MPGRLARQG